MTPSAVWPARRYHRWALTVLAFAVHLLAYCPAAAAQAAGSPAQRVRTVVDEIAVREITRGRVAGFSVAVVRGADTLLVERFGTAEIATGRPMPARGIFEAGSLAKQFTAAAILQLQDQSALDMDDPLIEYIVVGDSAITLRHLLNHTAGLTDYSVLPEFEIRTSRTPSRDSLLAAVSRRPPIHALGEAMAYSNTHYLLLALVVEAVSGLPYREYLRTRLFEPAGMRDSSYCDPVSPSSRRVTGHVWTPEGLRSIPFFEHGWSFGAASLCTTAEDLVAWNAALHGGGILSQSGYAEMIAGGEISDGIRTRYAAGLMIDSIFGRAVMRHSGSLPGFRAYLAYYPAEQLTIAVLANSSSAFNPTSAGQEIAKAVFGEAVEPPRAFRDLAARYTGLYSGAGRRGERRMRLYTDDTGQAFWGPEGGVGVPLHQIGRDLVGARQTRIRFLREGTTVVGAWLDEVGEVIRLQRAEPGL